MQIHTEKYETTVDNTSVGGNDEAPYPDEQTKRVIENSVGEEVEVEFPN